MVELIKDKLIRDNYASIISKDRLEIIDNPILYFEFLKQKLNEELDELIETDFTDPKEFADVIEVLYALAKFRMVDKDIIEESRLEKLLEFGGFEKCLILKR